MSELIVPDRPIYSQAISKYTYYVLCTKTIGHYFKHIFLYCKRGLRVGGQRSVLRRRPSLGKPQKKVLLLMTGPLRPNHPFPFEHNGRWNVGTLEKKGFIKNSFFLNGPAIKRRFFLRLPLVDNWKQKKTHVQGKISVYY